MDIGTLIAFAIGLIYLSSISGVGAIVLAALNDSTTDTTAQSIITNGQTGLTNFSSQFGTQGTVIGVVFLLGLVMTGLSTSLGGGNVRGL